MDILLWPWNFSPEWGPGTLFHFDCLIAYVDSHNLLVLHILKKIIINCSVISMDRSNTVYWAMVDLSNILRICLGSAYFVETENF